MIELMVAVAVIAVMLVGAGSAVTTSMRLNQLVREEAAAIRAAEHILAQVRATPFARMTDPPNWVDGVNQGGWRLAQADQVCLAREVPFPVHGPEKPDKGEGDTNIVDEPDLRLLREHDLTMGVNVGGTTVGHSRRYEGEVVLVTNETPDEAAYGRDLDADGSADGVDLNGVDINRDGNHNDVLGSTSSGWLFPLDLNGNGNTTDGVVPAADLQLLPVVVIVRWRSLAGGLEGRVQLMTVIRE
jgi:Tfp pilus assembly protein FimT